MFDVTLPVSPHSVRESNSCTQKTLWALQRIQEIPGHENPSNFELQRDLECIISSVKQNKQDLLVFLNAANRAEADKEHDPLFKKLKTRRKDLKALLISLFQMISSMNDFGGDYRRKYGVRKHLMNWRQYELCSQLEDGLPPMGDDYYGLGEDPNLPLIREVKGGKLAADVPRLVAMMMGSGYCMNTEWTDAGIRQHCRDGRDPSVWMTPQEAFPE